MENVKNNEIGIGILDIYTQEDLECCYSSIPEDLKPNIIVASSTNNKMVNEKYRKYGEVPMATLRNWLLSQLRINEYKYFFLLYSNQIVDDPKIFENTIKIAKIFGTWVILGDGSNSLPLEDEETGLTLYASPQMNTEFMFILSNIVKKIGYFDERFYNTKDLDVLDYIIRLRNANLYPPAHYNVTIGNGMKKNFNKITKLGFKEFPDNDKSVAISYGYFMHKYKYFPGQNDPVGITKEELLKNLQTIQQNYAKK
jgi:hypothetical protein